MRIYASQYKDQQAVTIESDRVAAQFLPTIGAKLASLVHRPSGFEFLVQRSWPQYKLQPYDGVYVDGECSGLDDMFPTIDECCYEQAPWKGVRLPDHGEVWSLPWEHEIQSERLYLTTHGVRFPYKLEKWVSFAGDEVLRIDYRLTNLAPFDMHFMWAAHGMFNLDEGATELVLPQGVEKVVSAFNINGYLGEYGDEFDWPVAMQKNGQPLDLRRIRGREARASGKYFVKGAMPEGWCGLTYGHSGLVLALSFPVEQVPYLALLTNEYGWDGLYNIFLEPCTASFDRIDVARLRKELSTVRARSTYDWYLNFGISEGRSLCGVDAHGAIIG
ncbi:MAG: aldose epimerase family protein [Anaerolineae bacterium]